MYALAQFIMSSRIRALLVAFAGNLLPLLSPATVVLVTARRGASEGMLVLLWSMLPLVAMLYVNETNPLMVWASLASVLVVFVGALVLKATASWQSTLLVVVLLSALTMSVMNTGMSEDVAQLRVAFVEMLEQMQAPASDESVQSGELAQLGQDQAGRVSGEAGEGTPSIALPLGDSFVLGLLAWIVAAGAVGSLLLGRWWQALLYNPGGFAKEFQSLRIQRPLALALLAGMTGCYLYSADYAAWGSLMGLPVLVAGLALIHHLAAAAKIGTHWLGIFYICLAFLLGPMSMMLVGLGLLDSMIDLRSRWASRSRGA